MSPCRPVLRKNKHTPVYYWEQTDIWLTFCYRTLTFFYLEFQKGILKKCSVQTWGPAHSSSVLRKRVPGNHQLIAGFKLKHSVMKSTLQSAKHLAFWSCTANHLNIFGSESTTTTTTPTGFLAIPHYFTLNILNYFYELKPQCPPFCRTHGASCE